MRMGKGKGSFDHWATRMAVSQILFELKGRLHEQVVRDAFRLAGNKLPGSLFHTTLSRRDSANMWHRAMGVRQTRRGPCRWDHEAGRGDARGTEEAEEGDCARSAFRSVISNVRNRACE